MKKLLIKRVLAFGIDYLVIVAYALLLFGITSLFGLTVFGPIRGQVVGFVTLTLPVFLYFYLNERSTYRATIGKRVMNISVITNLQSGNRNVLIRNVLKFLPWEIAHIGVHWIVYYSRMEMVTPNWVWAVLILPQIVVLGYMISAIIYKGEQSLYDKIANTKIEKTGEQKTI